MERWQNKVAVVTGASAGIGVAIVKALVERGMIVVGLARRVGKMENEVRPLIEEGSRRNFYTHKCDVSDEQNVKDAFKFIEQELGGIDVLVNNAAIFEHFDIIAEDKTEVIKNVVNTNILGVVWCIREAFRSMKQRNVDGYVINIGSYLGHVVPIAPEIPFNIYPATKHALRAMCDVLRQEFWKEGTRTRVTCISPGIVATELLKDFDLPEDTPYLACEDIADAVVYCLQTPGRVQIQDIILKPVGEKH